MPGKSQKKDQDRLAEYRRKRSAQTTPEPFGTSPSTPRSRLFVVQKHWASRKHYDLRLEIGGVLHSWAVPKGPSPNPDDKRLAMEVEEHPLEYADFEGIIPEGNYGAGAVIVFDRGRWVSHGDPREGLESGKLLFDLWGYKLRGLWTLFKTKGKEPNAWLLVKKPDTFTGSPDELGEESIFSGLTVEQLREGTDVSKSLRASVRRAGAVRGEVDPRDLELMLAETAAEPFDRPGWLFELKYDGFRLIAAVDQGEAFLRYRRGQDVTERFPELANALRAMPHRRLVLDAEVTVLDSENKPSFGRLQQRVHLTRPRDIQQATVRLPATLFVFDLLELDGHDVRSLPLVKRKEFLRKALPPNGPLQYADHWNEQGKAVFEEVNRLGFEGIMAKRGDAPYRPGRSGDWLKIRADRTGDFAVVGYSPPKGARSGLGSLHLAVHESGGLVYAGRVGTGFSDRELVEMREALDEIRRDESPCTGDLPRADEATWVEPLLVAEVRYKEWTGGAMLRHPVFLRLRDDKPVEQCSRPEVRSEEPEPPMVPVAPAEHTVTFSNLDKPFWPEEGYTKGDLIEYYRSVSAWLIPYLQDRPLVLTRYPDGIHGKNFYQKDAPGFAPEWMRTETMWSEHAEREIRYFVCEDEASLLYIINLGTIPLHLWSSRISSLQHPDWCILDLDPKQAPFKNVVRVARVLHELCEEIGLECFAKTSGSTGIHVLLPLGGQCTYEQSRQLAELLARVVASEHRDIATLARTIGKRGDRVYIDCYQNGHGKLLVAPYSVRPREGATVSAPLRWGEVNGKLTIDRFTIRTMPPRLKRQKADPLLPLLATKPDLVSVLAELAERLDRA